MLISVVSFSLNAQNIFDFGSDLNLKNWYIVNDDVMGGASNATLTINNSGHGVFSGKISLKNNGGFASTQHNFKKINVSKGNTINIVLKGDKKIYQFRIKENIYDYHSYVYNFITSGKWEVISINLKDMYPSYRGRKLNDKNFSGKQINQLSILISNKVEENFSLLIDKLYIK
ncbi:MAG: CIA30 family protein [Flavobacteriales bacterium TMED123]|nr:MAG: CIA30 family protein [Flavobacteriales bacterium TMED123]